MNPEVKAFLHAASATFSYVVSDPATGRAAVIDPVLDFNLNSAQTDTVTVDALIADVRARGLTVEWVLETHAHADHLSAAPRVRAMLGGKLAIGDGIREVQKTFGEILHLGDDFRPDGSQFDHLFADGEAFSVGAIAARVIATPGHTNDSVSYLIGDALFVGDTLFMPDLGTARCDFPGGDARKLYASIMRLYALPDATRMYVCHDYPPPGRGRRHQTSVAEQRASNIHVRDGVEVERYAAQRAARDATLEVPELLLPAVQVNIRAGELPPPEANGVRYLKIPVDAV